MIGRVAIYALLDEHDGVRYVGKTECDPKSRLHQHWQYRDSTHKSRWVRSCIRRGYRPRMIILEWATPENWAERERRWIKIGYMLGWNLTNHADGGIGCSSMLKQRKELAEKHGPLRWSRMQKRHDLLMQMPIEDRLEHMKKHATRKLIRCIFMGPQASRKHREAAVGVAGGADQDAAEANQTRQ